jgi:hypothetical protein
LVVTVQSRAGTPTVEVEISGSQRVCFRHRVRYFINPTWSILYRRKTQQFISIWCDRERAGNKGSTGCTVLFRWPEI